MVTSLAHFTGDRFGRVMFGAVFANRPPFATAIPFATWRVRLFVGVGVFCLAGFDEHRCALSDPFAATLGFGCGIDRGVVIMADV